jgi:hypothetical protein
MKITRINTIREAPTVTDVPELRLINKFLLQAGFNISDKIEVNYYCNLEMIVITKIIEDGKEDNR